MMLVDVVQYMRPDGRKVYHQLEIDDNCKSKYEEICSCECRLTCEQLQTGAVSQTIEHSEFDFDIILTKGHDFDENKKAIERLILRFNKQQFEKMLKEIE